MACRTCRGMGHLLVEGRPAYTERINVPGAEWAPGRCGVSGPSVEQALAFAPGHTVALDVAGDVTSAGQEAGVVLARRFDLGGDGRDVHEFPDCILVPTASRPPSRARPMGAWKLRKWVLRWSPSSRTITSLPA